MPITHIPKFPIVDPDPSLGKAISNFHLSDWLTVAAFAGSGYTYGFFAGMFVCIILLFYYIFFLLIHLFLFCCSLVFS
jgi:hypothetical protein